MLPEFPFKKFKTQNNEPDTNEQSVPEPRNADGNKNIADAHITTGHVHNAITRYKKAARMDDNPAHRTNLGDAYAYAELPIKALEQYKRALKTNPNHPETHASLAEIYIRYGKWRAAAAEYTNAVNLSPDNAFYRYKLAYAQVQAGCPTEAIIQLEQAVALLPDDGFYRFELATLYADARHDNEAVIEMEQAVDLCPDDDYYVARLGMLYARIGKMERAADTYRRAIGLCPQKLAYRCLLADMYYLLGYEARAEHLWAETDEIDRYETDFVNRARRYTLGGAWS